MTIPLIQKLSVMNFLDWNKQMVDNVMFIGVDTENKEVSLLNINANDQELLRYWKNKYLSHFFYKEKISVSHQQEWYKGYNLRPEDYLFIIKVDSLPIGCIGIRLLDDYWDVYNIIKGVDRTASKNCIAIALQ